MKDFTHIEGSHGAFADRPVTLGKSMMAGSGTQLGSQIGLEILKQGGNAVDSGVAMALAAAVLEPHAHYSIGGEIAFLLYESKTQLVHSIVGQGCSPAKATMDLYNDHWGEIPKGVLSTTVPGVVSALLGMLSKFGRLSYGSVARDAIDLAQNGFPVYSSLANALQSKDRLSNIKRYSDSSAVFLKNGHPLEFGNIWIQSNLATSLSKMADAEDNCLQHGGSREQGIQSARDAFYRGELAQDMVSALNSYGGLYVFEDFAEYTSPFEKPLAVKYKEYEIYTNGTWSQGIVMLQGLKILETLDIKSHPQNSAESLHLMIEALKLAYADRDSYIGDPEFVEVPTNQLLSEQYARIRGSLIKFDSVRMHYPSGDPYNCLPASEQNIQTTDNPSIAIGSLEKDGTTYISAADADGNMVSIAPSCYDALNQGMVLGGTGVTINCRGSYFWLDPDNPNALAPKKRPRTTPCTYIVLKEGRPFMTLGTPGGDGSPQRTLQVLLNILDYGMNIQEAISAPKFTSYSFPESEWPHSTYLNRLVLEDRIPKRVIEKLSKLGHQVKAVGPWGLKTGFVPIMVDEKNGVYLGGSDPRRDSAILGW